MLSCSKMLYCSKWSNIDMAAEPTERSAQRARARSSERFALTRTALAATRPADFERRAGIAPQQPLLRELLRHCEERLVRRSEPGRAIGADERDHTSAAFPAKNTRFRPGAA